MVLHFCIYMLMAHIIIAHYFFFVVEKQNIINDNMLPTQQQISFFSHIY